MKTDAYPKPFVQLFGKELHAYQLARRAESNQRCATNHFCKDKGTHIGTKIS